VKNLLVSLPR